MDELTVRERVRYVDCDPMGVAHHSVYVVWLEVARTELMRSCEISYAEVEQSGVFIVVARMNLSYLKPIRYDNMVEITVRLKRSFGARIEHEYELHVNGELACRAETTLACVNREGRVIPVPDSLVRDNSG